MADDPPRLPYYVLDTGYCLASEHHMMRGGRREAFHCHALVGLFQHPLHGWLLWDTGYAPRMLDATAWLPYRLYRWATPLRLDPALAVVAQLPAHGLSSQRIAYVVVSHFHADHLCGVRDFPHARIITTKEAYDSIANRRGFGAVRRGFIPSLLPDDFAQRATLLPAFTGPPLGEFGPTHDLFGDGSIRFVMLPGHARGQFGMLVQTVDGPLFFVADGAWMSQAIRENRPPHWITHLFVDDGEAVQQTLARLHRFGQAHPEVALIPTHCPERYRQYIGKEP